MAVAIDNPERKQLKEASSSCGGNVHMFVSKCPSIFAGQEMMDSAFLQDLMKSKQL